MTLTVAASTKALSPETVFERLEHVRASAPRVHAITNAVAQNFTANVLLALGAVPSMTLAPEEVAGFAASAGALLVNLGTLDDIRRQAIPLAIDAARKAGRPVCIDPVFVDRSPLRCAYARDLTALKPDLVRLNAAEMEALFPDRERVDELIASGTVIAVTGEEDRIESRGEDFRLQNGHPLQQFRRNPTVMKKTPGGVSLCIKDQDPIDSHNDVATFRKRQGLAVCQDQTSLTAAL